MNLKPYLEFTHPLITNVIRGFYITNGTCLGHSSFSGLYQGIVNEKSLVLVNKLAAITDDQLLEIEKEIENVLGYNQKALEENIAKIKEAVSTLKELGKANLNKYLDKEVRVSRPDYYRWYSTDFTRKDIVRTMVGYAKNLVATQEKIKQNQEAAKNIVNEAIQYCIDNGKKIGVDFTVEDAVETANDIAFEKKVAELKSSVGYIEFEGNDECENCSGWDMKTNRCSCGYRRVGFTTGYGHSFKKPYVYAEAH